MHMTQTGPDVQPPAQPGQPYQQWGPDQQQQLATPPAPAPAKSKGKKIGSIAGAVVVAGGIAAFRLTGGFGADDPSVGDCVQMQGETSFDVVDCSSADAQYRIVGKDDKKLTYETFQTDDAVCTAFAETEAALWTGDPVGAEGTTWCAVPAG
jgi:hypothetical protein